MKDTPLGPKIGATQDTFFDSSYVLLVSQETRGTSVVEQVRFIEQFLLLGFHQPFILDLCCGHGRHLKALSQQWFNPTGVDINDYFIDVARQELGSNANLICCDAREFVRADTFDVILNLESSLNSFNFADAEHVLSNVHQSLKKSGTLLLHVFNPAFAMHKLPRQTWFSTQAGILALEKRVFDLDRRLITVTQIRLSPSNDSDTYRASTHQIRLTLFTCEDLQKILFGTGFRITHLYGDFKGSVYEDESPNIILLCEKEET